jgi:two-component system chemotaxis sensor kinase CheA
MSDHSIDDPILDMYIFENSQLIEQLETSVLESEKSGYYGQETINDIFRVMHTIKGSSAMMLFNNISHIAHAMEDLFYFIRENKQEKYDCLCLSDLILAGVDFIKSEIEKIKQGNQPDGNEDKLIGNIKCFLATLKENCPFEGNKGTEGIKSEKTQYYIPPEKTDTKCCDNSYKIRLYFEDGCEMENIRAYTVIHNLKDIATELTYTPEDIIQNEQAASIIREKGFVILLKTSKSYEELNELFMQTIFLKSLEISNIENDEYSGLDHNSVQDMPQVKIPALAGKNIRDSGDREVQAYSSHGVISVNLPKLNKLMDLVGEMVVAEAMVTQNPDLEGLELENFQKASRQLKKITHELQDMVMSIRMVPVYSTFQKMHRIVRDMSRKLDKEVNLEIVGEETEVDKNIIDHISDPLMHIVRNSIDHGIESAGDRLSKGKPQAGTVTLEARNAGSDVLIIIKDDGSGLDKRKILNRASENGLLHKPENEMTDKEIYSLIFLPGFSTNDDITEFSGRGVGMDVVVKNIEAVGGTVYVDSTPDVGTTVTMKIPLTLAIIDGMNIRVGKARYTIPTTAIRESFRPLENDIIRDPDGNEMLMVRGNCYPILRIHEVYRVKTQITNIHEGIIIIVENGDKTVCIFADELIGEQQVVVKALPKYIKKIRGLAGCTLLGDGNISLIIDVAGFTSL